MARGTSSPTNQDDIGKDDTSQGSAASMATNVDRNAGATMDPSAAQGSAIEMLKQDHRKVEGLFEQFEQSSDDERKEDLVEQICEALILHMRHEEDIFYPACRKAGVEEDTMDEAQVEHDGAKAFLNDSKGVPRRSGREGHGATLSGRT